MSLEDTRARWAWLADTTWIVPTPDLPALLYRPRGQALRWMVDQTVWHVQGFKNGYIWGVCAVMLTEDGGRPSRHGPAQLSLLGTVTPSGDVLLTFVPTRAGYPTVGQGRLLERAGQWVFEMQMSTDRLNERVLHWANMVRIQEGDPRWGALPGVGLSVPEMLEGAKPPSF